MAVNMPFLAKFSTKISSRSSLQDENGVQGANRTRVTEVRRETTDDS